MLSRVGSEQMGNFVREELERAGVDTSALQTDPERHTGLVLLALKDRESFPLLFYRRDCADMAIDVEAITLSLSPGPRRWRLPARIFLPIPPAEPVARRWMLPLIMV